MQQQNNARSANYLFMLSNDRRTTFSVQSSNVADLQIGQAPFAAGPKDLFVPGNKIETEPLLVQFIISEDWHEWLYMFKWMLKLKNNNSAHLDWVRSCELAPLDANNQPTIRFVYKDCWPFMMEGVQMSSLGESIVLTSTVTFRYNRIAILDADGNEISEEWNGDFN